MMKHASAAASTMVALISSGVSEGFTISAAPNPTTRISSSSTSTSSPGNGAASIARIDSGGQVPSMLSIRSSTRSSRQKRRAGELRLQAEGGRDGGGGGGASGAQRQPVAAGAAAAASPGIRRRPPQRQQRRTTPSSVEGAIQRKYKDEVEELKENLQRFASLRMWRQAMAAFEKAKKDGLPITSSTYTQVINVMSKGGRWKEAIQLLDEMIAAGSTSSTSRSSGPKISPSVVSYNAAITACSRANKTQVALRLLGDMSAKSGLSPDLYSYAAVLSGLARARNPSRAVALLGEMREAGVEPDLVCLAATMEACKSKGAVEEAGVVLEQLRELDPPPSTASHMAVLTTAISACVTEGAWEQATDWLTDARMLNGGDLPPASAYAAAANACARAGQAVRARALISELEGGGRGGEQSQPTLECYNAVVLGCATSGDLREALRTLKEDIPRAGFKPDTHGFNHALRGMARAEDWEGALALLNEQRSGEFPDAPPDRNSYNAAIDACGRAGQVRPALALLDAMRTASAAAAASASPLEPAFRNKHNKNRLRPDRYSYGGALQACRAAKDGATALRLLRAMKETDSLRGDQRSSLAAFSAVVASGEAGKEDAAAEILEEMLREKVNTSEGALASAKEALLEMLGVGAVGEGGGAVEGEADVEGANVAGGDGVGVGSVKGGKFARVLAAFDALEAAQAERAASRAERAAAEGVDA